MKEIKISDRLMTIGSMVTPGARVADIGTDHARLPVWLLQQGRAVSVIASDVLPLPLERARTTLEYWGLLEDPRVSLRLGNGLQDITAAEIDTVVIAGMGGETILQILSACPWIPDCSHQFLLQPMSSADELRRGLRTLGFCIWQERLVRDNGTLYTVLEVQQCEEAEAWEPWMAYVSPALMNGNDPLRDEYIQLMLQRLQRALDGARRSGKPHDGPRAEQFAVILEGLKEATGRKDNA